MPGDHTQHQYCYTMTIELNVPDQYLPKSDVVVEANAVPDILLSNLVGLVDDAHVLKNAEIAIPLTVHVSGLIVSGDLVSYKSYFEGLAGQLREDGSADRTMREALAEGYSLLLNDLEVAERDRAGQQDGTSVPAYIHLRDATTHSPGNPGYFPKTLWRGRLSHVSAWSMGRLDPGPSPR